jgi:hypothetical protein
MTSLLQGTERPVQVESPATFEMMLARPFQLAPSIAAAHAPGV